MNDFDEDTDMDIESEHGTEVRYVGEGGWDGDKEKADTHLTAGEIYTVDYTEVHSWSTRVYLLEVPNVYFNSVLFAKVEQDV